VTNEEMLRKVIKDSYWELYGNVSLDTPCFETWWTATGSCWSMKRKSSRGWRC